MTKEEILAITDEEARIDAWLEALTLAEKVALLAGSSMWFTTPVERLGIPAIKVTDGPNGARGGGGFAGGSMTSACFPVGISLASTWNVDLITRVGAALGDETLSKGAQMLLAPTVNIHRSPLNGRNFECYSEDPYLSARMAVGYINGLQSRNVGATVKHYVCNDSEFERNTINVEVDERTMREIYLPPFQAAVQEAKTWGVMASYNRVNGTYAAENQTTLVDILKHEWGFDGIVMSDWFGTKSTVAAANHGLALEMPGPPQWRGGKLLAAAEAGEVDLLALDDEVRRMLRLITRSGAFETGAIPAADRPERADNRPEHRALIRAAAAEGVVLLKNEGNILPLDMKAMQNIAIIGPNARTPAIMGGGSAQVSMHYAITPYDGVAEAAGEDLELRYAIGCTSHKSLPPLDGGLIVADDGIGSHAWTIAYYNSLDLSGEPVHTALTFGGEQIWMGQVAPGVTPGHFSARMQTTFKAAESGSHSFGLSSAGLSKLLIDGRTMIDNWTSQTRGETYFGTGSTEVVAHVDLQAGQTYHLEVDYSAEGASLLAGVRLGFLPPVAEDSVGQAAALAAQSDVAVLFVGLNGDWESEGFDRPNMDLPAEQNALIEAVAAANPRTVVVLQTGSPVTMPWLDRVAGVLQAWYPGQECGNAISDVLFGAVTASGKLTQTFPVRLEDNPAYINYPGEHGRVRYGEGIFVGYRYYEQKDVAPLFPFGFGLSYTTFAYENVHLSTDEIGPDGSVTVSVNVHNTGTRAGQEIVQFYVRDVAATVARPPKELRGFVKLALEPGATATATVELDRTALAFWHDERHAWAAEAGEFEVLVGSSSQDIHGRATFRLTKSVFWGGPVHEQVRLTIDDPIKALLQDDDARAVLERHLPGFAEHAQLGMVGGMTLVQISTFAPNQVSPDTVAAIASDLAAL